MNDDNMTITGLVLAGGRGTRMGGADKGLVLYQGRPLVAHVCDVVRPQVTTLLVSCNRNQAAYEQLGYSLVNDNSPGFRGPLAGILSANEATPDPLLFCCPCDTPHLPGDLVTRLLKALKHEDDIAIAHDGNRPQPLCCLVRMPIVADIALELSNGRYRVQDWMAQYNTRVVDFSDCAAAFHNINSLSDLVL